jgi:hypothetical protein
MLIFGLFGHFHTEVNLEMIPNLSRRAAKSLKIESCYLNRLFFLLKIEIFFLKKFKKKLSISGLSAARQDSQDPQILAAH